MFLNIHCHIKKKIYIYIRVMFASSLPIALHRIYVVHGIQDMNNNLFIQLRIFQSFFADELRFAFKDNVSLHLGTAIYYQMVSTCKPSSSCQETPIFLNCNFQLLIFKSFLSNISCVAQIGSFMICAVQYIQREV